LASGLSQTTSSPAASAATQIARWVSLGVITASASIPSARAASPASMAPTSS
jgi:hypothetical protein